MGRIKRVRRFQSEAVLCEALSTAARALGFKVYSETGTFDLLLVAGDNAKGFKPGDQIGVHAKLHSNVAVLYQALPKSFGAHIPHYYCVLVPEWDPIFNDLAGRLKISVISGSEFHDEYRAFEMQRKRHWYRHDNGGTVYVPDCEVIGMKAGIKAPIQLTRWKMEAIKLCILGVERGYLTSTDFLRAKVSMSRWVTLGWIKGHDFAKIDGKRMKRYVLVDSAMPPHLKYPEVTDAMGKAGVI